MIYLHFSLNSWCDVEHFWKTLNWLASDLLPRSFDWRRLWWWLHTHIHKHIRTNILGYWLNKYCLHNKKSMFPVQELYKRQPAGKVRRFICWAAPGKIFYEQSWRTANLIKSYCNLQTKFQKNGTIWRRRMCIGSAKQFSCITNKWMSWAPNCPRTHRVLRICPRRLFPVLQPLENPDWEGL